MEHKHTPGPWRVDPHHRFDVQTEDGRLEISTTHEGVLVGGIKPDRLEQAANARLIAAAPDLLEALEAVSNGYCCGHDLSLAINEVQAAIAKATGSQP